MLYIERKRKVPVVARYLSSFRKDKKIDEIKIKFIFYRFLLGLSICIFVTLFIEEHNQVEK